MDGFLGTIKELILLFVIISVGSTVLDYGRVNSGSIPIFCTSKYSEKTKIQKFRGLFYQASRKVTVSPDEDLSDSTHIKFYILTKNMNVPSEFKSHEDDLVFSTTVSDVCGDVSLYYSGKDTNVYTYCLDSIKLSEDGVKEAKEFSEYLNKDSKYLDELLSFIPYRGFAPDRVSLFYRTDNKEMVNNGLTIYQCHSKDNKNVYIGPVDMEFKDSFCGTSVVIDNDDEVVDDNDEKVILNDTDKDKVTDEDNSTSDKDTTSNDKKTNEKEK